MVLAKSEDELVHSIRPDVSVVRMPMIDPWPNSPYTFLVARKLFAHGKLELLVIRDPHAGDRALDLYLDLEKRAWKKVHGVGRHAARIAHYRALFKLEEPFRLAT